VTSRLDWRAPSVWSCPPLPWRYSRCCSSPVPVVPSSPHSWLEPRDRSGSMAVRHGPRRHCRRAGVVSPVRVAPARYPLGACGERVARDTVRTRPQTVLRPRAPAGSACRRGHHHHRPAVSRALLPVGHTTTIFVAAGLLWLHFESPRVRAAALAIAIVVGLSRAVVGVHWPVDIAAGAALVGLQLASARPSHAACASACILPSRLC